MAIHFKSTNWNHSITFLSSTCLFFCFGKYERKVQHHFYLFSSTAWGVNNEAAFSISRMENAKENLKWIKNQWKLN